MTGQECTKSERRRSDKQSAKRRPQCWHRPSRQTRQSQRAVRANRDQLRARRLDQEPARLPPYVRHHVEISICHASERECDATSGNPLAPNHSTSHPLLAHFPVRHQVHSVCDAHRTGPQSPSDQQAWGHHRREANVDSNAKQRRPTHRPRAKRAPGWRQPREPQPFRLAAPTPARRPCGTLTAALRNMTGFWTESGWSTI